MTTSHTLLNTFEDAEFAVDETLYVLVDTDLVSQLMLTFERGSPVRWAHLTVSGDRLLIALLFTVEALPGTVWIALVTPVYFRLVADWLASVDVARHDPAAVAGHVDEVDAIIQHVVNGWSELTMWQHLKPTDPGSTGVSPRA